MMPKRPRLFLVDAFNLIFRAYHARQRSGAAPMRTSRGTSTEAIYIFHNMIRRIQRQFTPDALAAAFESEGPTLRDQEFAAYKANRAETPPELIEQIPNIARLLAALSVPVLQQAGYEADDVIGTIAQRAAAAGYEVTVVSSDKDMLQLVGDGISVLDPMKNDTLYDAPKVQEFKGVPPERIADLLALSGDSVDNIPGAPGIGEKGAVQLLGQFGSLDALLERAVEVPRKAYRESLLYFKDQILLSKRLATIHRDAPLTVELDALQVQPPDREALAAIYRELEFFSFLKELDTTSPSAAAADTRETTTIETAEELGKFLEAAPADEPVAVAFDPPAPDGLGGGALGLATASASASAAWPLLHSLQSALGRRSFTVHDYKSLL
ncbi:MAG: 5'-3' exonuclease H3TH domain-containing protein, partial [Bryobacteraceae bacterium]